MREVKKQEHSHMFASIFASTTHKSQDDFCVSLGKKNHGWFVHWREPMRERKTPEHPRMFASVFRSTLAKSQDDFLLIVGKKQDSPVNMHGWAIYGEALAFLHIN